MTFMFYKINGIIPVKKKTSVCIIIIFNYYFSGQLS